MASGAGAAARGAAHPRRRRSRRLRDGRVVSIRAIRSADAPLLREFDGGLSEASRRFRCLSWKPPLSAECAARMASVDSHDRFALVATTGGEGHERVVADCRLLAPPGTGSTAEIAIAVADDHQDVGLGRALLGAMLATAADRGFEQVVAQVRYDNGRMMHLLGDLGFSRAGWDIGVVTFSRLIVPHETGRSSLCRSRSAPDDGPGGDRDVADRNGLEVHAAGACAHDGCAGGHRRPGPPVIEAAES